MSLIDEIQVLILKKQVGGGLSDEEKKHLSRLKDQAAKARAFRLATDADFAKLREIEISLQSTEENE